jgi:molybdopterin-containing oxidoreductase family membrane subunit
MLDVLILSLNYLGTLFVGYAFAVILLLIGARRNNFLSNKRTALLEAANITASSVAILYVAILTTELTWHYYNDPANEHQFVSYRLRAYLPSIIILTGTAMLSLSVRIRRSIPATFLLIVLFNVSRLVETFWRIITSFSRDYLPSSWSYYVSPWYEYVLLAFLYTVVFMMPSFGVFKIREHYRKD